MSALAAPQARELTEEEQAARAKICFDINQRIKGAIGKGREALWELGTALYEFNELNGWTALNYESQAQWLADPEITMTKSWYTRMIRRHRELRVARQLPVSREDVPDGEEQPDIVLSDLDPSKIDIVMPAIVAGVKPVGEILYDVRELGARDLRDEYGVPQPEAGDPPPSGEDDVIEGKETENGVPSEEDEQRAKEELQLAESAAMVDSWLEMGGDRRKARRHLRRLVDLHPLLHALAEVEACVEAVEEAPDRSVALEAWRTVVKGLRLILAAD